MKLDPNSFALIVENLHDGLYCVDTNRVITFWNKAAARISGFSAEEVVGRSCADNILTHVNSAGVCLCSKLCPLAAAMVDGHSHEAEVFLHHKDGHRIPVLVRANCITNSEGRIIGGVELFSDISHFLANSFRVQELEKMALLDNLTQLANRNYLDRELQTRFEEYKRLKVPFGLLFMDIDHFKKINDSYGHDVGDEVLKFVAQSFTSNSRPFDLYGRWGGEEFLAILRNITAADLLVIADRLRQLVETSYIFHKGIKIQVTISLGVTVVRDDDDAETVLQRADHLLYYSKQHGRNRATLG